MANIYPVKTSAGDLVLPTASATLYTDTMSADHPSAQFYLEFFSDAAGTIPATPSAGTVAVAGTPSGNVYLSAGNVATITASTVTSGAYEPPKFEGCMIRGRVVFDGIVGAAYCRAFFWRN